MQFLPQSVDGGSINLPTSIGDRWQRGPINSPTVLNSSLNVAQFWDGRAADLKEQAGGPIANPERWPSATPWRSTCWRRSPPTCASSGRCSGSTRRSTWTVTGAIAEFEKTLVTPNSRFDQWLLGRSDALTAQELEGYKLFKESGCVACRNGEAVGGNSFPADGDHRAVQGLDVGGPRGGHDKPTGSGFKVPTLRNVELTYPYFHDGAANTLAEAVDVMGRIQLGRTYTKDENDRIVAFLKT
ncbi:MAG: cytochrome c peroxidase [Paracoccaceae bacterium]